MDRLSFSATPLLSTAAGVTAGQQQAAALLRLQGEQVRRSLRSSSAPPASPSAFSAVFFLRLGTSLRPVLTTLPSRTHSLTRAHARTHRTHASAPTRIASAQRRLEAWYAGEHASPTGPSYVLAAAVCLILLLQVVVLAGQRFFGPRWFVPGALLPRVYRYHHELQRAPAGGVRAAGTTAGSETGVAGTGAGGRRR